MSLMDGIEVTGEIDDVALTEEENELVQRAVQQRLASTLREYETTKLGLTQEMEAITKEEKRMTLKVRSRKRKLLFNNGLLSYLKYLCNMFIFFTKQTRTKKTLKLLANTSFNRNMHVCTLFDSVESYTLTLSTLSFCRLIKR